LILCYATLFLLFPIELKVHSVGLALMADNVGQEEIGQYMGYVALGMSIGILIAPLLGGIVFDRGGYNAVFAMTYGVIGLDIIMRFIVIEKKIASKWELDEEGIEDGGMQGNMSLENGTSGVLEKQTVEGNPQMDSGRSDDQVGHGTPVPGMDRKKKGMRLPPMVFLLSSRRLLAALWASLVQASLLSSFDSVLAIHVQRVFGWTSTGAGLLFIPLVVPSFLSPLAGWLADKHGARLPATIGFVFAAPLFICLRFVTHDTMSQKVLLCALLALIGAALAISMPPLLAEITYLLTAKEKKHPGIFGPKGATAQVFALYNLAFAGGCIVGPLWAGLVVDKAGWGTMSWSIGLLSALTAIPTFIWVGGSFRQQRRASRNVDEAEEAT
jgi:MFS family permease